MAPKKTTAAAKPAAKPAATKAPATTANQGKFALFPFNYTSGINAKRLFKFCE